jgi:hypothetical protein
MNLQLDYEFMRADRGLIKSSRSFAGKLLAMHGDPLAWRGGSGNRKRVWVSG